MLKKSYNLCDEKDTFIIAIVKLVMEDIFVIFIASLAWMASKSQEPHKPSA